MEKFDVIVVGGGPAGYPCAIRCSQNGYKSALIEKADLGGCCLNKGCIPTKCLFEIAHQFSPPFCDGVHKQVDYDWMKINNWIKTSVVARLRTGVGFLLKQNGVSVYSGTAIVKEPGVVEISGNTLTAKRIVLATGSKVAVPSKFAGDPRLITSDTIWDIENLPESCAVIGAGPIGCEFASILSSLGVRVKLFEMMPQILPGKDTEIVRTLEKLLTQKGIELHAGSKIDTLDVIEAEKILWATGRTPNTDSFAELGLKMEGSAVKTDETLATSVDGVYAIGDVNGKWQLAYVGTREAEILADRFAGRTVVMDYSNIPEAIFTIPEVGVCGMTEEAAKQSGRSVKTAKFPYQALGKAHATGSTSGFIKIVADASSNEILGVHIIGGPATEMVSAISIIIQNGLTADEALRAMYCHPTFSEAIMEALLELEGRPVHVPPKKK
jgi:dihydrolipoamide dehydrogenase